MNEEASVGELIKQLRDESTTLIKEEIALVKTEMGEKVSLFSRNVGYLIAGALVAYSALVIILIALGSLLTKAFVENGTDPAMAHFLGLTIVGVVVGAIGAFMAIKAINTLKGESLVPNKTIETLKHDKQWATNQIQ